MKYLSTLGLCLGIIGVVIIFFFGPPQPHFKSYIMLEYQGTALEDLRETYDFWSKIGLGFICAGFITQIIAIWIRPNKIN